MSEIIAKVYIAVTYNTVLLNKLTIYISAHPLILKLGTVQFPTKFRPYLKSISPYVATTSIAKTV